MIGALHMETSFVICFQVCESTFIKRWLFVILIYERLRPRTILQRPQKLFFTVWIARSMLLRLYKGRHWPPFWCGGYCYLKEVKITAFFAIQLIPLVVNSIELSSKIGRIFFISHIKQVTNSVSELKTVLWEYRPYFSFVLRLELSTVSVNVFAVRLNYFLKLVIQCWNVFPISCHWPVYHSFWWDTWRKYF